MRTGTSTSRHRGKKRDFIARLHRRRRLGHFLVDRDAKRTPLRKRSLPSAAAGHQLRAQARDRGDSGRNIELLAGPAELLAQTGWLAGLSTSPSAHAVDISTAESCVG